jgi:hypothetical protein
MSDNENGPPRGSVTEMISGHHTTDTSTNDSTATERRPQHDVLADVRRRCEAAARMPLIHRRVREFDDVDDYDDGIDCDDEITDVMLDAAVAALLHLERLGAPGLLDLPTCRAIWSRRRAHRQLAFDTAQRLGWSA